MLFRLAELGEQKQSWAGASLLLSGGRAGPHPGCVLCLCTRSECAPCIPARVPRPPDLKLGPQKQNGKSSACSLSSVLRSTLVT